PPALLGPARWLRTSPYSPTSRPEQSPAGSSPLDRARPAPAQRFRGHQTQSLTVGRGLDSLRSWPVWHAFSRLVCPVASLSGETVDPEPPAETRPQGKAAERSWCSTELGLPGVRYGVPGTGVPGNSCPRNSERPRTVASGQWSVASKCGECG